MKRILFSLNSASLAILLHLPVSAQQFSSGSDGSYGPMTIFSNTTLALPPDGIFRCSTITIGTNITLRFIPNALNTPVYLLATEDVLIYGLIDISGENGTAIYGGKGGPGGFDGGSPDNPNDPPGDGYGPGAGKGGSNAGNGGFGPQYTDSSTNSGPRYGNNFLSPLVGGSGGGGSFSRGGGGGGGAILIASNRRILISGTGYGRIFSHGGNYFGSGAGSGGAVRLVAPTVAGGGEIYAYGGGRGRIRIDTLDRSQLSVRYDGVITVGANMLVFPPVPSRLDIMEAAGQAIPEATNAVVQVHLPSGASTNSSVKIQARNFTGVVPINVVVTPENGPSRTYPAQIDMALGNPAQVTVNVVFPGNVISRVHAWTR